jgi:cephalosporin-C deacetylase
MFISCLSRLFVLFLSLSLTAPAFAQKKNAFAELTGNVVVQVVPQHKDWRIDVGERATFEIRVTRDGQLLKGATGTYELGLENLPADAVAFDVTAGTVAVTSQPSTEPGFIGCAATVEFEGRTYKGRAAVGVAPEKIAPTTENPADFDAFWDAGKKQLAAIALDAKFTPAPERSAPGVECYHTSVASAPSEATSADGKQKAPSRLYGILCEPHGKGPFPAVLQVPGAGIRSYSGDTTLAAKGIITFTIGIHGIPVNLEKETYDVLNVGALGGYPGINSTDRDRYYYRRVYLGTVRAMDLLMSRPRVDRKNVAVTGGSQGGALAIITAALDPRVRALVSYFPALSDHAGFLKGRTGGWPFLLRPEAMRTADRIGTLSYYDVVNFARRVKAPGFYSWGYNDVTCPPTSTFAAYNVVKAPKKLLLALETGHSTTPEQRDAAEAWLLSTLGVKAPVAANSP